MYWFSHSCDPVARGSLSGPMSTDLIRVDPNSMPSASSLLGGKSRMVFIAHPFPSLGHVYVIGQLTRLSRCRRHDASAVSHIVNANNWVVKPGRKRFRCGQLWAPKARSMPKVPKAFARAQCWGVTQITLTLTAATTNGVARHLFEAKDEC